MKHSTSSLSKENKNIMKQKVLSQKQKNELWGISSTRDLPDSASSYLSVVTFLSEEGTSKPCLPSQGTKVVEETQG